MKRSLALATALGFLTACGGGGSGSSTTPSTPAKAQTQSVTGTVVISIPLSGGQSTSAKVRYPQFVSPNASSVAVSINGGADQLFNVAAGSPLCTTTGTARNCTLTFAAPAGSDSFAFLIFAGAGGTGAQLASATTTQAIAQGVAFNFTVAMNAVIGTVVYNVPSNGGTQGNCPDQLMNFNGISEGCAGNSGTITFTVFDPSGAQVTGTAPFATPMTITANDPSVTASPNQITAPGQTTSLTYSGATFGASITNALTVNVTIGSVVIPATVPVRRSYLYVANSNAAPGTTPAGGGNIAVYQWGATGTATPVRTLTGGLTNPVQPLLDSNDNLWVLDNGPYTSNSNPYINVYAPGATGSATPISQITGLVAVDTNRACESMAFNPAQTELFVTCDDDQIHVFPTNFSGSAPASSLQTVAMNDSSWAGPPVGVAFDYSGNLYVAQPNPSPAPNAIDQYVVSSLPTTGNMQPIFPAQHSMNGSSSSWPGTVAPLALAVDNSGTLFSSIAYFNSTMGAPDANNQIGIWQTTTIPCNNCAPSATLLGGFLSTHAPAGIAFDPAGNLYVSNPFNDTINAVARALVVGASVGTTPTAIWTINTGTTPGAPNGMVIGP